MLRNTNMNSQDNMPPTGTRDPITVGPEKCNTAETQDTDFKIAVIII